MLAGGALAGPAAAHPAGPPPSALLSADGSRVVVDWSSAPDDAAVIGVHLGLLPPDAPSAYVDGAPAAAPSPEAVAAFSASSDLHDYLLDHVAVTQDGAPCRGAVRPIDDFLDRGARLVFVCPAEVEVVDVEVTLLTSIDEAYRSFGVSRGDASPDVTVFTAATPSHTWDFAGGPAPSPAGLPAVGVAAGVLAAAGVLGGGLVGLRRRSRAGRRR